MSIYCVGRCLIELEGIMTSFYSLTYFFPFSLLYTMIIHTRLALIICSHSHHRCLLLVRCRCRLARCVRVSGALCKSLISMARVSCFVFCFSGDQVSLKVCSSPLLSIFCPCTTFSRRIVATSSACRIAAWMPDESRLRFSRKVCRIWF